MKKSKRLKKKKPVNNAFVSETNRRKGKKGEE